MCPLGGVAIGALLQCQRLSPRPFGVVVQWSFGERGPVGTPLTAFGIMTIAFEEGPSWAIIYFICKPAR